MARGTTTAQIRRRARRQTNRATIAKRALTASATAFKDFPLSARDAKWDSTAAEGRVRAWAGAEKKPNAKYASAFLWKDSAGGDNYGDYKLGYVDIVDGKPVAVWAGLTAAAGAIQGARGGVKIPADEVAGVKSHIARYYEKAKTAYDDDTIVPPWENDAKSAVVASLRAAGIAQPTLVTTYDLADGTPAERFFYEEALRAGFSEMDTGWWPSEAQSLELGKGVVFRVDDREQVVRLKDGTLCHVRVGYGSVSVRTAGPAGADAVAAFRSQYPASYLTTEPDGRVPITFWMMGQMGPVSRLRRVDAQPWATVERNYSTGVRAELDRVMSWSSGDDAKGQLLLWQGEPGTGKTWALRALASQWSPWAEFHYVTDPDQFFGKSSQYMVDVLLSDSYSTIDPRDGTIVEGEVDPASKWKILILEDTGDLLASNARDSYSAGLSRLLNVVDGMIGQGLRVLALVTTNDQLDDFHPAVTRPGRCASQLSFGALSAEEAAEWLGEETDEGGTLAELYARQGGGEGAFAAEAKVTSIAAAAKTAISKFWAANPEYAKAEEKETGVDPVAEPLAYMRVELMEPQHADVRKEVEDGGVLTAELAEQWIKEEGAEQEKGEASLAAMGACANCDHAYSVHLGTAGPCTTSDCSCNSYKDPAKASLGQVAPLAEAYVRIRPDMTDFRETVERELAEALSGDGIADRLVEGLPDEQAEVVRLRLREFKVLAPKKSPPSAPTPAPQPGDGATDPPIPIEHQPQENLPPRKAGPTVKPPVGKPGLIPDEGNGPANASVVRWQAVLCPEGTPTDDGRIFAPGSIEWRELPLTLMAMIETAPGHDGAQVAGRIDRIWQEGANVMGEGVFDTGDYGMDIARMVGDGTLRGVSVDIAILAMEIAYRSDVLDAKGNWVGGTNAPDDVEEAEDDNSPIEALFDPDAELMLVVWRGKIGAATVCPFPAFADASIEIASLAAGGSPNPLLWRFTHEAEFFVGRASETHPGYDRVGEMIEVPADGTTSAMIASAAPDGDVFCDPELEELTPVTVDGERVYGHAAAWDTCHIGIPEVCTTAPSSHSAYSYFHLKEVECVDGQTVSVGTITLDTGHAGKGLSRVAATRHYDDTGTAVADVVCGEDEHGIWFSGALRPGLTDEQLRALRGSALSGDWRNVNGNLELVALLCVNVPGFPIPRVRALIAAGDDGQTQVLALVAAGVHQGGNVSRVNQERLRALLSVAEGLYDDLAAEAEAAAA